jgi:hypothetical protein
VQEAAPDEAAPASVDTREPAPPSSETGERRAGRSAEALRKALRDLSENLGARDLEMVTTFAEFLKARRAARSFAHHAEMAHESTGPESAAPDSRGEPDTRESQGTPSPMAESGQRM